MANNDWDKVSRAAKKSKVVTNPQSIAQIYRSSGATERTPPPRRELTDSRGQPISLPKVSILEERGAAKP